MGGAYSVQIVLNGAVDEAAHGGQANDSRETGARSDTDIYGLGGNDPAATPDRGAVVGSWPSETLSLVAAENFESGSLDARWATNSSTENLAAFKLRPVSALATDCWPCSWTRTIRAKSI